MTYFSPSPRLLTAALVVALVAPPGSALARSRATTVRQALAATGADADAGGTLKLKIRRRKGALEGQMVVRGKKLDARATFDVTIDGVRVGTLSTNQRGKGRARFRTTPRKRDQILGVDPRGRALAIRSDGGAVVLMAAVSDDSVERGKTRCCLPDDSGTECEDRTPAECAAEGGVDLGAGSCLPNPCAGGPGGPGSDVVCCLPDDFGPECEDRTATECSALGGVNLGTGSCLPNPCAPIPPVDGDVRCCLPDDSGPECEDRTPADCAAAGGVNIGAGTCLPNPCLPGATTTTTLAGGSTTTTSLPAAATLEVRCERRADRSSASVTGRNLFPGRYRARLTSGANVATSDLASTVGDEVEHDFDSQADDIAAGATAIAPGFLLGEPPQATGSLLDTQGTVLLGATVTCDVQ